MIKSNDIKESAAQTISLALFENMVDGVELLLNGESISKEVKYNAAALNESLQKSFNQIEEILQQIVDKFYRNYYEVNKFMPLTISNLDFAIPYNLEIVNAAKKLIRFAK